MTAPSTPGSGRPVSVAADDAVVVEQFREAFNRGEFFEAHEILEMLWLPLRRTEEGEFWQALIQLAAVFVHLGKGRLGPARQLLRAAGQRLERSRVGADCRELRASAARVIQDWGPRIASETPPDWITLLAEHPPQLDGLDRSRPGQSV